METPDREFGDQLWDSKFKGSIGARNGMGARVLTLSTLITVDGED